MITRIKRLAQFLFDNADLVERFLSESDHYRSMELHWSLFKHTSPELEIRLSLYDETGKSQELQENAIIREKFIQLCDTISLDSGVTKLPEPVEVRNELDKEEIK